MTNKIYNVGALKKFSVRLVILFHVILLIGVSFKQVSAQTFACTDALYFTSSANTNVYRYTPTANTLVQVTGVSINYGSTQGSAASAITPSGNRLYYNDRVSPRQLRYNVGNTLNPIAAVQTDDSISAQRNAIDLSGNGYYMLGSATAPATYYTYTTGGTTSTTTGPFTFTVQPSAATAIATGGDFTFDANNVGYLVDQSRNFYRLDFTTNTAAYLGTISGMGTESPNGVGFSGTKLYISTLNNLLYEVDLTTLAATLKTPTSTPSGFSQNDIAACVYPNIFPTITATKAYRNVTKGDPTTFATSSSANPGDTLEYRIVVRNSGSISSGNTTFLDTIPSGVTYTASSTTLNGAAVTDATGTGNAKFFYKTAQNINGPSQGVGALRVDTTPATITDNEAVIIFRVTVNSPFDGTSNPIPNTAQVNYAGASAAVNSNTVNTTVDVSDLQLTKSHTGNFAVGSTGTYSFTVRNTGTKVTSGTITVSDPLPAGLTVNGGLAGSVTPSGTNAASWTCSSNALSPQTITCNTTTGTTIAATSGTSIFTFSVNVGATTLLGTNSITNTANVSGGSEVNTSNNSSPDPTTVVASSLAIVKSSNGPWLINQTGAQYTLTVTNTGTGVTSGVTTVSDVLPSGITANWTGTRSVTSNGVTWGCTFSGQNVACTTSNSISNTGTNTSQITLPVNVTTSAPIGANSITNYASVGGGGDPFNNGTPPTAGTSCTNANHCTSHQTTINNQPPVANNVTTSSILNSSASVAISALSGSDPDGTVASYRIETLPPAASGILYLCNSTCNAVTATQVIVAADANKLQFDPTFGYAGNATFTFTATDNLGAVSPTAATYTIPVNYQISCSEVYASGYSGGRTALYRLNGSTMTAVYNAPQIVGGLAISSNGSAYYDDGTFANPPLFKFNGTIQTNTGMNLPTLNVGEAADAFGNVYYLDDLYHLRKATSGSSGAAIDLGALIFDSDDTIGPTMKYGDMTFDGNGRLYWYGSINNGQGRTYLYVVDPTTLIAQSLGDVGPDGATGVAFDSAGNLITTKTNGADVVSINLASPNLIGSTIGTASPTIYDLGSCATPIISPSLINISKSVVNITKSQTPATSASTGDILEYTVVVNNSGNMPSYGAKMSDAIPFATTYKTGSTTLNGISVTDVGGAMPFATSKKINSPNQTGGVIVATSSATVKFQVTVNSGTLPATINNTANITYPTVSGGVTTSQSVNSNTTITPTYTAPPVVGLVKSCPLPANCTTVAQLPNTDLTYQIVFTNTGGQGAANLVLVDGIPDNTDFKIGSATSNVGTTGLTILIEYSSTYPAWTTYPTPVSGGGGASAGYDRLVKAIRWSVTSGVLSNVSPNNTGNVGFVTKIR
jgi:uncharacterized repeat protein (TIGR01451 family)